MIIGTINYQLLFFRNEYLKPIDIKLFSESKKISKTIDFVEPNGLIYIAITLFASSVLLHYTSPSKVYIHSLTGFLMFSLLLQSNFIRTNILRIKSNKFSDFDDYKKNGFLLTFIINISALRDKKPAGYSPGISQILLQNVNERRVFRKPNIIIIMNESFFNINDVEELDLSYNPIPNIEKICRDYTSGNVISPMLGGGTCQPEYEMLTGYSVLFDNKFKIAFIEHFKKTTKFIDSIAWTLRKQLYSCTFIHPFDKSFYNREKAYDILGFEKIIDISDFDNAFYPRSFVSDKDCYKKLIGEYEQRAEKKPFFSVVVTMQNHPGYLEGKKYDEHGLEVLTDNVTRKEKIMLENYSNLLKESDDAVKYLVDYFEDKDDTAILFFGDHQPSNNIGFSRVKKRSSLELSKTPFFIWNNYGLPKKDYGNINPSYLSAILLEEVGIKSDKYFNYLYDKLKVVKAFDTDFVIDGDDNYIKRENSTKEIEDALKELHLIQYDKIHKEIKF